MKTKINNLLHLLCFSALLVTSCQTTPITSINQIVSYYTAEDEGTATIKIFKDNNSTSKERYISPSRVDIKYTYDDLSGILANNENVCPSIGDVNLLVIPVHLPTTSKTQYNTEEIRSDIEKVFFSENDSRLGFKSLKEYYKESSYGKVNFSGKVTEWFDVSKYTNVNTISKVTAGMDGSIVSEILPKAVSWAKETQEINLKDYDKNQDGSIDAIWLVYDHLDFMTEYSLFPDTASLNQSLWNFTYWDTNTLPTDYSLDENKDPTTSGFTWASFDMMYTSYANLDNNGVVDFSNLNSIPLDSHTYIHEMGHLLGLDDYYANDDDYYHPAGKTTMMDQNICDLDSYSKMLLGWVKPYVVYGTSEILIPKANASDRGVIVIPSNFEEISERIEKLSKQNKLDDFRYEFNPFSEYIMIDLYTPDGLNQQDSFGRYINGREDLTLKETGVRIYHIDSRIFKCTIINYEGGQMLNYVDGYEWDGGTINPNQAILMPISNQKLESTSFQLPTSFDFFDQIRLLEASGLNTFNYDFSANEYTLWTTESDPFSIEKFGQQFFNANYTFNDGSALPFKVVVTTLKEISR